MGGTLRHCTRTYLVAPQAAKWDVYYVKITEVMALLASILTADDAKSPQLIRIVETANVTATLWKP